VKQAGRSDNIDEVGIIFICPAHSFVHHLLSQYTGKKSNAELFS